MEEVEGVTGMNYEEAVERYNITQIAPNSENFRSHYKRLGKDKEYRKKMENSGILKSRKTRGRTWKKSLKNTCRWTLKWLNEAVIFRPCPYHFVPTKIIRFIYEYTLFFSN